MAKEQRMKQQRNQQMRELIKQHTQEQGEHQGGVWMIEECALLDFVTQMKEDELAVSTIKGYYHDVREFFSWINTKAPDSLIQEGDDITYRIDKKLMIAYKSALIERYTVESANHAIIGINKFLKLNGAWECTLKTLKTQSEPFRNVMRELSMEEYNRLLDEAYTTGRFREYWILQTLASTGIRVSELKDITVESLEHHGTRTKNKGKTRYILYPDKLCEGLRKYANLMEIKTGPVFTSREGNPINRSNLYKDLRRLCVGSGVNPSKVYPHNFRCLFAALYYENTPNLALLADILGHSNVNTTRHYTRRSPNVHIKVIEDLGLVRDF